MSSWIHSAREHYRWVSVAAGGLIGAFLSALVFMRLPRRPAAALPA